MQGVPDLKLDWLKDICPLPKKNNQTKHCIENFRALF